MYTCWTGSAADPVFVHPEWPADQAQGLFSFRVGGVSEPPFDSLNVGMRVSDRPEAVIRNRQLCAERLGGGVDDLVIGQQVHGAQVAVVGPESRGRGARDADTAIPGVDALVTDCPGLILAVMAADCVPVLFFDPVRRAVGAAHSGWKGTVHHVARRVVETMQEVYRTNPEDLDVWIGPSIRRCCYEVDEPVIQAVYRAFARPPVLRRFGCPGKYWLSLQDCIRMDLMRVGVRADRIHDTGICTHCHPRMLFSHRADRGKTGRQMGAVRLQQDFARAGGRSR
ncbi:MAG: peptidoglycan editing factor PgeF [Alicyclobacillus macrosporangiidus]|uniref:peptidoglycan editing factor PgeF n=1 Tax=Alicyclobacillus macrosporangiidus TaxID=392015 RepID=UPI0026EB4898|nr:peptidoglycan editing factor PgeF [Alicyclobacillus macrosporangiidus]MCL6598341.1 peptidoglycan editing factor PgeF [Alicyclobacillus macrosporangiidus]